MSIQTIGVLGAGVMGSGIALTAAQAGFSVILFEPNEAVMKKGLAFCTDSLKKLCEKGKITEAQRDEMQAKIRSTQNENEIIADLVIEAIPENLELKKTSFAKLELLNQGKCILASNTSTLPITRIAGGLHFPNKVVGMHFFNPAPIMKLVEVIPGELTDEATLDAVCEVAVKMGKVVARVKDEPGFIVNRVARHYYLESLRLLEEQVASHDAIDRIMEASGFRMGPFRLMDLIGVETNHSVTRSLYESFFHEPRFRPSRIQQKKVDAGNFGRKTGRGFYSYE